MRSLPCDTSSYPELDPPTEESSPVRPAVCLEKRAGGFKPVRPTNVCSAQLHTDKTVYASDSDLPVRRAESDHIYLPGHHPVSNMSACT